MSIKLLGTNHKGNLKPTLVVEIDIESARKIGFFSRESGDFVSEREFHELVQFLEPAVSQMDQIKSAIQATRNVHNALVEIFRGRKYGEVCDEIPFMPEFTSG